MRCPVDTPFGTRWLRAEGGALTALSRTPCESGDDPILAEAAAQLREYFAGNRHSFDLPLAPAGTDFRRAVWAALREIPYGETRSYGQIAAAVGKPRALRAVGQACHCNPIPILIPCHRVVGADRALTGFASGLDVKRALLRHEGVALTEDGKKIIEA